MSERYLKGLGGIARGFANMLQLTAPPLCPCRLLVGRRSSRRDVPPLAAATPRFRRLLRGLGPSLFKESLRKQWRAIECFLQGLLHHVL